MDFGDAPDSYNTTFPDPPPAGQSDGAAAIPAAHGLSGFPVWLGFGPPDPEPDGQPTPLADGDDLGGIDDEDGVIFDPLVVGGSIPLSPGEAAPDGLSPSAFMHVRVSDAPLLQNGENPQGEVDGCLISAWIDWLADGSFGPEDQVAYDEHGLFGIVTDIPLFIPPFAAIGPTYARIRCSTFAELQPFGFAPDGEVEDYLVTIETPPRDFGDAPLPYPTILDDGGFPASPPAERGGFGGNPAWHDLAASNFWLGIGPPPDSEPDGQPSVEADGDDGNGADDEDGAEFTPIDVSPPPAGDLQGGDPEPNGYLYIVTGQTPPLAPAGAASRGIPGCWVSAWVDFGQDGSWFEEGDQVLAPTIVPAFSEPMGIPIFAPPGTLPGFTYARVRCSSDGEAVVWPDGSAPDGEVEDYLVELVGEAPSSDFGDAPFPYPTSQPYLPASHDLKGFPVWLGAEDAPDDEPDGQESALADGDDLGNIDDEDGVTFSTIFVPDPLPPAGTGGGTVNGGEPSGSMEVVVSTEGPPPAGKSAPDGGGVVNGCYVSAWIDFGRDGSWLETQDQIAFGVPVEAGIPAQLEVYVPPDTAAGDTYARIRCSTIPVDRSYGPMPDGEVEDYFITLNDLLPPDVVVEALASPAFVYTPGSAVTITAKVTNAGSEAFTLESMEDSLLNDLNGLGTCSVPQFIPGGQMYQCEYPDDVLGDPGVNTRAIAVSVIDNAAMDVKGDAELDIKIHPVPAITVVKSANPLSVPPAGGKVTYSLLVSNDNAGVENLVITQVEDDKFGVVSGQLGDCPEVPFIIGSQPGADALNYACSFVEEVSGNPDTQHVNTITVDFEDEEGTLGQDSDDATVNLVEPEDELFKDSFERVSYTVFITSEKFTGDLVTEADNAIDGGFTGTGLEAGDALCNLYALKAGLAGTYTAWLSDSGTDARDRVTNGTLPYLRPDGVKVADNLSSVITGIADGQSVLFDSIRVDEYLTDLGTEDDNVYTGTGFTGVLLGNACTDWTAIDSNALVGASSSSLAGSTMIGQTTRWTQRGLADCNEPRRIYCFED